MAVTKKTGLKGVKLPRVKPDIRPDVEKTPAIEIAKKISIYCSREILRNPSEEILCDICGRYYPSEQYECPFCFDEEEREEESFSPEDFSDDDEEAGSEVAIKRNFLFENSPCELNIEESFMSRFESLVKNEEKFKSVVPELAPCDDKTVNLLRRTLYEIFELSDIESGRIAPEISRLTSLEDSLDEEKPSVDEGVLTDSIFQIAKFLFDEMTEEIKNMYKQEEIMPGIIINDYGDGNLYQEVPSYLPDYLELSDNLITEERMETSNFLHYYKEKLKWLYYTGEFLIREEKDFFLGKTDEVTEIRQVDLLDYIKKRTGRNLHKGTISRIFSGEYVQCPDGKILPLKYFQTTTKQDFLEEHREWVKERVYEGLKDKEIADIMNNEWDRFFITKDDIQDFRTKKLGIEKKRGRAGR